MGPLLHHQPTLQDVLQGHKSSSRLLLISPAYTRTTSQLNSIGLSKNILRALQASKADTPPLEAFPKSHIVTFKYYVGVILFLEEDYIKVSLHFYSYYTFSTADSYYITGRRPPDRRVEDVP